MRLNFKIIDMAKEIWRDIPTYEGHYQSSSIGRIRSIDRKTAYKDSFRNAKGRVLSQTTNRLGYKDVSLRVDGKRKTYGVHQLVAMAFLDHQPCGHEKVINHIDGNPLNNNIENLEVVTHRDNCTTRYRKNEGNYSSKYVGVSWDKEAKKWVAAITIDSIPVYLGMFDVEIDAHYAYQKGLSNIDNPEYFEQFKRKGSSKYKYINFDKKLGRWTSRWDADRSNRTYIGSYLTEELAYEAQQQYLKDNNIN